jgi:glycosyltransferase involved in cell wall biosynthesis
MAVLDAWAYGLPVITTPVGGIPDIAKDGENLLLFEPGDVNKLSECIEALIDSDILREKLSKESLHLAQTTFNIETINNQISSIYSSLLKHK